MNDESQNKSKTAPKGIRIKTVAYVFVTMAAAIVCLLLISAHRSNHRIATIRTLASLKYPSDLALAQQLCTKQGFEVLKQLPVDDIGTISFSHYRVLGVKSNPGMKDVQMGMDTTEGQYRISLRLVERNGWKLHNVYFHQIAGKKVDLWETQIMDHPVLSYLQANSDQITQGVEEFLKTAKNVADVIQAFKNLSEEPNHQRR